MTNSSRYHAIVARVRMIGDLRQCQDGLFFIISTSLTVSTLSRMLVATEISRGPGLNF